MSPIILAVVATAIILRGQVGSPNLQLGFEISSPSKQRDCQLARYRYRSLIIASHYVRAPDENVEITLKEVRRKNAASKFFVVKMAAPWPLACAQQYINVLDQIPTETERRMTLSHIPYRNHRDPQAIVILLWR